MPEHTELAAVFLAVIAFGFSIGFGQEMAKDLRQFRRHHRFRAHFDHENLNPPSGPPPLKLRRIKK